MSEFKIHHMGNDLINLVGQICATQNAAIMRIAKDIADCVSIGGTLYLCGNGGSAADCQHIAAEFVGRFKDKKRGGLRAVSLTADTSALTAIANDFGYDNVFSRQVAALIRPHDILLCLSTSGRSQNVLNAAAEAHSYGARVFSLTGEPNNMLAAMSELAITVPSDDTARIQECHIFVAHVICELVEQGIKR